MYSSEGKKTCFGMEGVLYKRFPGTKMKRQSSAASIKMIHIKQKSARLLRIVLWDIIRLAIPRPRKR
jgi:hypothetical protein